MKTQLKYHEVHPLKAHNPVGVGEFTGVRYPHFEEKPWTFELSALSLPPPSGDHFTTDVHIKTSSGSP